MQRLLYAPAGNSSIVGTKSVSSIGGQSSHTVHKPSKRGQSTTKRSVKQGLHDVEAGIEQPVATRVLEEIVDEKLMKKKKGGDGWKGSGELGKQNWWEKWCSIRSIIIALFLATVIFNGLFIFLFMYLRNEQTVTVGSEGMDEINHLLF